MISEHDRDELRRRMPELLEARCGITDLRRSFRCPSPAHDDRDPSAHYYENDNTVHCFGCGKTWDVFSLIGELGGIGGFAEQTRAVADAVGYRLSDDGEPYKPRPRARRKPRPLFDKPREAGGADCACACGRAFEQLYYAENDIARRYLRWRGLDDGDARNKEWRPRGLASPLWREWLLSASADVVYVAEGLIDAMALAKITRGGVMALGGVANAKRLGQVIYKTPPELRPKKLVVCMDEDAEGRRTRDKICADLDVLRVSHAVMPPYPGGAKDADEWLMAGRGAEWEFEQRGGSLPDTAPLWYTRWL